jgi:hypothetical protein
MKRVLLLFVVTALIAPAGLSAQSADTFEVASIRTLGEANAAALARLGDGCDGGFPRVEQNRFTVTTTVYALITWAYGSIIGEAVPSSATGTSYPVGLHGSGKSDLRSRR